MHAARQSGPADVARKEEHVIGCRLTQETRVVMRVDEVAGNICSALPTR